MRLTQGIILFVVAFFSVQPAVGEYSRSGKPFGGLLKIRGDFHYSNSEADQLSGTYESKFKTGYVGSLDLGVMLGRRVYLGVLGEYWNGKRDYDDGGGRQLDQLRYLGAGVELGWVTHNPRIFYLMTVGAVYPISLQIRSGGTTYEPSGMNLAYQGKITLGVRSSHSFFFQLAGGYRHADFKSFTSGSAGF